MIVPCEISVGMNQIRENTCSLAYLRGGVEALPPCSTLSLFLSHLNLFLSLSHSTFRHPPKKPGLSSVCLPAFRPPRPLSRVCQSRLSCVTAPRSGIYRPGNNSVSLSVFVSEWPRLSLSPHPPRTFPLLSFLLQVSARPLS
ncbi:hypothetical protein Pcinc_023834 [Petrolisthes cinctipes]|uniref:Uncharacterized protein n=1 Tax=Petrolisthes cinctipes TaxID=88211 RepID=A0AAE1FCB4_PETCI|nr:hypothetical protein Pcinc_023834 [Petrolisthes cinctipes]